jgi:hypothetical protein
MKRRIATIAWVLALALLAQQAIFALHRHGAVLSERALGSPPRETRVDPAPDPQAAFEIACALCASAAQLRSCAPIDGPGVPLAERDTALCREPAPPPRLRELQQTSTSPRSPPDRV